uniref:Raptor N-terminal CASPase-like domain-containing protein n=1 Tax=Meloidogyne incognita TaxID=6306 RepID=A0A914N361_MELIC
MNVKEKQKVWFREARHIEEIKGAFLESLKNKDDWRKIRERMKTVSVALVLCLNVGVDPPDIKKPLRCARKEAWVDPSTSNPQRSSQKIGQSLQKIYEKLQPRARYKSAIDPTVDCVRKLCTSMRRNAKDERVLFHFNGHGVPKPSDAGEIWVFDKNITQYIPLSLYDLQSWMGVPSVYLWDCNSAGTILRMFMQFADDHSIKWMEDYQAMRDRDRLAQQQQHYNSPGPSIDQINDSNNFYGSNGNDVASSGASTSSHSVQTFKNCIQLGACSVGETLPFHCADLPADLFTCCLITPIQTSLLCHMLKLGVKSRFPQNIIDDIPGVLTDRRTLLGELNWIFTAITDTIAWSCLSRDTFQKLFRQDLLIASLFRSFLLAQRIMLENGCHVVSTPELPSVHAHPLWEYWDYVLDLCIANMYNLLQSKESIMYFTRTDCYVGTPSLKPIFLIELPQSAITESEYAYSWFFIEQLQAFEVWLKFSVDKNEPPQQLPVVLQVLLSQIHRVRALELLARFVDLGPWAVVSVLTVGIFPYVLKLLQCGTRELRPALTFIWAKILAIDPICQHDLVKDNGYYYFLQVLNDQSMSPRMKIVSAFVMATIICNNYRPAQDKLVQSDYVSLCIELLSNQQVTQCRMLCLWLLIGLGRLWSECDKARWQAIRNVAYDKAVDFLSDEVPEVRAAAVYALGCFVHNTSRNNEHATAVENEVCDKLCENCIYDGSIIVRAELASAIQWFVIDFQSRFAAICIELDRKNEHLLPEQNSELERPIITGSKIRIGNGTVHAGMGSQLHQALASVDFTGKKQSLTNSVAESSLPKRSMSSVYSIIPRSASLLYPASRQSTNSSRKCSLLPRSDCPTSSSLHIDSQSAFKYRILAHIRTLEAKAFIGPFERIWLCVLRLGLDPFEDVSKMGERIITYIFELSTKIKEARTKVLEFKQQKGHKHMSASLGEGRTVSGRRHDSGQSKSISDVGYIDGNNEYNNNDTLHSNPSVKFLVGSPSAQPSTSSNYDNNVLTIDTGNTSTIKEEENGGEIPPELAPTSNGSSARTTNSMTDSMVSENKKQELLSPPSTSLRQSPQTMDNAKRRLLMDPFIHHSLYTPKRSIFGTKSGAYSQVNNDISDALLAEQASTIAAEGLVRTSFVDWCAKTWTEPLYGTIYDDSSTSTRNSLVNSEMPFTVEQPTDWAIHIHDGIWQKSKKEMELIKDKKARCEVQCMKLKFDQPATSLAWSLLRPYVYISDGGRVRIYSYPTGDTLLQQQSSASQQQPAPPPPSKLCSEWQVDCESFLLDSITDLMVVNGLTHELLMTGSRNGLLKIWDPQFCEHSYSLKGQTKLITATYLLNDMPRLGKGNKTLYHWDQDKGRLICSGNVRICRIWDAWAEKSIFDVSLRHGKGSVVNIASDLSCDLVGCGFSDGTLAVFDTRLPSNECEIMRLRDSNAPVVGMGILRERQRLLVGTRDGLIRLWEPRMFQEPVAEFNVVTEVFQNSSSVSDNSKLLHQMEVQRNAQLVACAMADSSVYIFDIAGRGGVLSKIRYPSSTGGGASSYFHSPSSAIGGLSSLFLKHTRRRSSSGGSSADGTTSQNTTNMLSPGRTSNNKLLQNQQTQIQPVPAAMRFHQYRVLLGVATVEGQFRAFSMPNVDSSSK